MTNWREALDAGRVIGPSTAPLKLIEFADLECPFCRSFHKVVLSVLAKYPEDVALVFVHAPLNGHRFAHPAARAAECAQDQGRFALFVDHLYTGQDSPGLKTWVAFARDAGVQDTSRFAQCAASNATMEIAERGTEVARKLEIRGTPTVLLNDWRFGSPPSVEELETAIDSLRKRKGG